MKALGFGWHTASRRDASQPSNCDIGHIFYLGNKMSENSNFQMFRGYIHDTEDIVYLRVNVPAIKYGLGQEPYKLNSGDPEFTSKVIEFCKMISVPYLTVHAMNDEMWGMRYRKTTPKDIACVTCKGKGKVEKTCHICDGTGKMLFEKFEQIKKEKFDA